MKIVADVGVVPNFLNIDEVELQLAASGWI